MKNFRNRVFFGTLLIVLAGLMVLSLSAGADAQVNVRVKNIAHKFERIMTDRFLKGYFPIEKSMTAEKGKGPMGGDATVTRVYATKNAADLKKMMDDKSIIKSDVTRIVIKVDVFEKPTAAQKVKIEKADSGTFSGTTIGDQAWSVTAPKKDLAAYKLYLEEKAAKEKGEKEPKETTEPKEKKTPAKKEPPPKKLSPRDQRLKDAADKKKAKEDAEKDKELQKVMDADITNFNAKQLIVRKKDVIISIYASNYTKLPDNALMEGIAQKLVEAIATKGM